MRRADLSAVEVMGAMIVGALFLWVALTSCTEQQRKPTRQSIGHPYVPDPSMPRYEERN